MQQLTSIAEMQYNTLPLVKRDLKKFISHTKAPGKKAELLRLMARVNEALTNTDVSFN